MCEEKRATELSRTIEENWRSRKIKKGKVVGGGGAEILLK
jgi:hypothetical protein